MTSSLAQIVYRERGAPFSLDAHAGPTSGHIPRLLIFALARWATFVQQGEVFVFLEPGFANYSGETGEHFWRFLHRQRSALAWTLPTRLPVRLCQLSIGLRLEKPEKWSAGEKSERRQKVKKPCANSGSLTKALQLQLGKSMSVPHHQASLL